MNDDQLHLNTHAVFSTYSCDFQRKCANVNKTDILNVLFKDYYTIYNYLENILIYTY